ncbi:hypothetical protein RN001_003712 [Aquatica leii]|uniref:Uncharacterized protein n=1 Tax=Aquatica leii TaxID=1421715 RepID=A0AAN7PP51_9COLE|nr:hypothetical protein RN001_003712 [Aquatica leii]
MENEIDCTPPEVREVAKDATKNLLPVKSKAVYEKEYVRFNKWCKNSSVRTITENSLLAYFVEMQKTKKPTSMWIVYSMLSTCLNLNKNVDISKYHKLQAFLKLNSTGDQPKKSKILDDSQINKFLNEANDQCYLGIKVLLIIGIFGACRRDDLIRLTIDDVVDYGSFLVVFLRDRKNNKSRTFTITDKGCPFQPCTILSQICQFTTTVNGNEKTIYFLSQW